MSDEVILNLSFNNQTVTDLTGNWTLDGTPNATYEQIEGRDGYSIVTGSLGRCIVLNAVDQNTVYNEYTVDFDMFVKSTYTSDYYFYDIIYMWSLINPGSEYSSEIGDVLDVCLKIGGSEPVGTTNYSPIGRWVHVTLTSGPTEVADQYCTTAYVDGVKLLDRTDTDIDYNPFALSQQILLLTRDTDAKLMPNGPGICLNAFKVVTGIHMPDQNPAISLFNLSRVFNNFCTWLKGKLSTVAFTGSYNDLSNKPTISTVNDGTLTIQQNGTNVQTFTANASTNKTVNIQCVDLNSNQTVGGIKTFSNAPVVNSIFLDGKIIDTDANGNMTFDGKQVITDCSIPFHNSYPRCKYLGNSITDAQNTAIKNRTYDDLFIGDYWTINDVNWRIVAIDYYYNVGDTNFNKGNIIVMPDTILYNAQMNETNTTAGAYAGSLMRTQNLNDARTIAQNAFGLHLANHRISLANSVDTSGPNNFGWYGSDGVELPNEVQIYGTRVWGSALKGFDVGTQKQQFPLMLFAPQFVNTRQNYWLQDVASRSVSGYFAIVHRDGYAVNASASYSGGVRPSVTLSYI